MSVTADRTVQRMAALERANESRLVRAGFKRELLELPNRESRAVLADALESLPVWLANMDVDRLLALAPGMHERVAEGLLYRVGVRQRRRVSELTPRQRKLLAECLRQGPQRWSVAA